MARSLGEMASKGQTKLSAKASSMAQSYNSSKPRAIQNYNNLPFGPTRKANYAAGVNNGTYHAPDPNKWSTNWQAKMSE